MKKLTIFEVWHTNEFGIALHKQKARDFRDAYNRSPVKIQQTFFDIVNSETGETVSKDNLFEHIYSN